MESEDYSTYIANLRGIGCPEQTIRDLITAELNQTYAEKLRQLQAGNVYVSQSEQDSLMQEERDLIDRLMGTAHPKAAKTVAESTVKSGGTRENPNSVVAARQSVVEMPLALQNVDLKTLPGLQDAAVQNGLPTRGGGAAAEELQNLQTGISQIRQDFTNEVGGTGQNPSSPAYLKRWQRAQPYFDEQLMILSGDGPL